MRNPEKTRLFYLSIILFIIQFAIYMIVPIMPAASKYTEVSSIQPIFRSYAAILLFIFLNNLTVALFDFAPFAGIIYFVTSSINTALYATYMARTYYGISGQVFFLTLFTLPHAWLELPAYPIATAFGIYQTKNEILILKKLYKREKISKDEIKRIGKQYLRIISFVAIELFLAASLEAGEIIMRAVTHDFNILPYTSYAYLFWLPAIPMVYALYLQLRSLARWGGGHP